MKTGDMRPKLLYALLVLFLPTAFACKKEVPVSDSIIGTWELSVDYGGWSGTHYHKAGNDTLAVFTAKTYAFYQHGTLIKSGTYTTKKDTAYVFHQLKNRIIFDGQDSGYSHEFFDIADNQLSIYLYAYDAGSTTYRRIK